MMSLLRASNTFGLLIGVSTVACIVAGCTPGSFGVVGARQKDWHNQASTLIDQIKAKEQFSRQEIEKRLGVPDEIAVGSAFVTGHKELDKYRAYTLRLRGWLDGGDPSSLLNDQWMTSTIIIYDEKSRYAWPIAGDWRAYLFQVQDAKVIAAWDTYPSWTPWEDDYWNDVRDSLK